jgi:cytochrome c heme-lyase
MRSENDDPEAKCPVDPKTREAWLQAAKAKRQSSNPTSTLPPPPSTPPPPPARFSLDTGAWIPIAHATVTNPLKVGPSLPTDREISTIPRALSTSPSSLNSAERAALPANSEVDTGHDSATGNWIYPSQEMFFNAMKRKGHTANPADMSTIVPIHNAVNEKAWQEIKKWESLYARDPAAEVECGGPRLVSFAGDSKKLTPKARWNSWIKGYAEPFDRHDWVVERCLTGEKVEYVIDFYKGKGGGLAFHLDARPKVNSWEGVRMRVARTFGW